MSDVGTGHGDACLLFVQEARKLWQQVCGGQDYAADVALIAEAHALLASPQQPNISDALPPQPPAAENGSAAAGQHARTHAQQVGFKLAFPCTDSGRIASLT